MKKLMLLMLVSSFSFAGSDSDEMKNYCLIAGKQIASDYSYNDVYVTSYEKVNDDVVQCMIETRGEGVMGERRSDSFVFAFNIKNGMYQIY